MKKSLRIVATATVLTTLAFNLASANAQNWTARSIEDVKATLSTSETGIYVIQWGDTLSTIAKATGYTVEQLASINAINNVDLISAGSVLYFDDANQSVTYVNTTDNTSETFELSSVEEAPTYVVAPTAEWVESTVVEDTTVVDSFVEKTMDVNEVDEVAEVSETPVVEIEVEETTAVPVIEEITVAPSSTTVAEVETPKVTEEVVEVTEVPVTTTAASNTGLNEYGGIISEAKEWIAMKESGGQYEIWNPTHTYYGRYQLTASYLNGDYSRENQEKVADEYVLNRYGSWEAAKAFWEANGWY